MAWRLPAGRWQNTGRPWVFPRQPPENGDKKAVVPTDSRFLTPKWKLLTHRSAALGAELAVGRRAADGAGLHVGGRNRLLFLLGGLAGFLLCHLRLGRRNGIHQVLHGIGDLAGVVGDKPLADGAEVLVHLSLLAGNGDVNSGQLGSVLRFIRSNRGDVFCFFAQFIKKCHIEKLLSIFCLRGTFHSIPKFTSRNFYELEYTAFPDRTQPDFPLFTIVYKSGSIHPRARDTARCHWA